MLVNWVVLLSFLQWIVRIGVALLDSYEIECLAIIALYKGRACLLQEVVD